MASRNLNYVTHARRQAVAPEALVLAVLLLLPVLISPPAAPEPAAPAPVEALESAPLVTSRLCTPAPAAGRRAPVGHSLRGEAVRHLAQSRGICQAGGIRTSKARRAALLEVLT